VGERAAIEESNLLAAAEGGERQEALLQLDDWRRSAETAIIGRMLGGPLRAIGETTLL